MQSRGNDFYILTEHDRKNLWNSIPKMFKVSIIPKMIKLIYNYFMTGKFRLLSLYITSRW